MKNYKKVALRFFLDSRKSHNQKLKNFFTLNVSMSSKSYDYHKKCQSAVLFRMVVMIFVQSCRPENFKFKKCDTCHIFFLKKHL